MLVTSIKSPLQLVDENSSLKVIPGKDEVLLKWYAMKLVLALKVTPLIEASVFFLNTNNEIYILYCTIIINENLICVSQLPRNSLFSLISKLIAWRRGRFYLIHP